MKCNFRNDYSRGAHPRILDAIVKANSDFDAGYGLDRYSKKAKLLLKSKFDNNDVDIHFVSSGTQANLITLSAALKSYEAVIAPSTSHTNVHESGAVEATGHKIITVDTEDGKLTPDLIKNVLSIHTDEHMVKPRVVFISNSTELGTCYGKKEIENISKLCKKENLFLYLDGARLGQALVSKSANLKLSDLPKLVDAFYIGGTKNGALFGEAIVLSNPKLKEGFRHHIKQRGAFLAKGKVLGVQFIELFKDNLYIELAKHSQGMGNRLYDGIAKLNYKFLTHSKSNQIFPILPNKVIEKLKKSHSFYVWSKINKNESAVRLVTSWETKEADVSLFLSDLG